MTAWRRYLRRKERARARTGEADEEMAFWAAGKAAAGVDSDILKDIPWRTTFAPTFTYLQETPIPGLYRHPDGSWQKRETQE